MSRRTQENIFAGLLFLLFLVMLVVSFNYGPRARLVPVPIAILCMGLLAIQIVWQNLRPAQDLQVDALELIAGESKKVAAAQQAEAKKKGRSQIQQGSTEEPKTAWQRFCRTEFAALGVVLILLTLFLVVGPIPAVFIFSAGYFMLSGHWSPIISLLNGVVFTSFIYIVFGFILGIQLNKGALAPYIAQIVHF